MVLPGGPDFSVPLAIAPDDLRQLAAHDAAHRTFPGRAGPLTALDTGGEAVRGTALLVAGYTGSKEDFAPLLAPLAEAGYRVVALDQRGQYESPGPDDPAAYSVAELGQDVVAVARVLREESGEPLHLLGHSFGGLVTRAAVLAEPALFTSFTLLGSGPSKLTGRRADLLDHLGPLLDEGGVALVHQTLETGGDDRPQGAVGAGPDPRVLLPPVPGQLRGGAARDGRGDARPSPTASPSSPPRGCRCSSRTARPTTPGSRTSRPTWRSGWAPGTRSSTTRSTPPPSRTRPGRWRCCSTSGRPPR